MTKRVVLGVVALVVLPVFACGSDAPANATAFCNQAFAVMCDKVFECVPAIARDADFVADFGSSASECKTMLQSTCTTAATECPTYKSTAGGACVNTIASLKCAEFTGELPDSCNEACPGLI